MRHFLIADDHPLFSEALVQVLERALGEVDCVEVRDLDQACVVAAKEMFDLILLDLYLPGADGFSGLVALRNRAPSVPIVVVSASESGEAIRQAMRLGAAGYLPKSSNKDIMAAAIRLVLSGGTYVPSGALEPVRPATLGDEALGALTRRQLAVLERLAQGKSNKQIARDLDISEITVKAHISAILRKLGVTSRTQAIVAAARAARV